MILTLFFLSQLDSAPKSPKSCSCNLPIVLHAEVTIVFQVWRQSSGCYYMKQ